MRSTSAEMELSKYGSNLLQSLEDQGHSTGWMNENTQVTRLIQTNKKVISGVKTPFGDIKADVVVICVGLWSPYISPSSSALLSHA